MKKYLLMHDYGCYEGWRILAEGDTMLEIVEAREQHLSYGDPLIIMESHDTISAYTRAGYDRRETKP